MGISLLRTGVCIQNRDILKDVSIPFSEGLHLLIGLNGSGKSTLLRTIAGFLPYSGQVQIDQKEIGTLASKERARLICWVPQSLAIPFELSVRDFVVMGRFAHLHWLGHYQPEDYRLAEEAMTKFGIESLKHRSVQEISGGERQKAILSRAWCQQADIWLLDEPDQALDPRSKAELWQAVTQLKAEGKTVICATHETGWMRDLEVDHVVGMRDGQVFWEGPPTRMDSALLAEIYAPWPSGLSMPGWR